MVPGHGISRVRESTVGQTQFFSALFVVVVMKKQWSPFFLPYDGDATDPCGKRSDRP